ncbi:hypothetical protein CPB85DRAFT_88733 [Mucidula mucida]|nr:hypothetical protein CPB85DRAFT_88733 [Mucidula mucida]
MGLRLHFTPSTLSVTMLGKLRAECAQYPEKHITAFDYVPHPPRVTPIHPDTLFLPTVARSTRERTRNLSLAFSFNLFSFRFLHLLLFVQTIENPLSWLMMYPMIPMTLLYFVYSANVLPRAPIVEVEPQCNNGSSPLLSLHCRIKRICVR